MSLPEEQSITLERRLDLLRSISSLQEVGPEVLHEIATCLQQEHFAAGSVILSGGVFGDRLYIVESGVVGVFTDSVSGIVQLGKLGVGDAFGEISLNRSRRRRRTTIKALTPVVALTLSAELYRKLTSVSPEFKEELACALDDVMEGRMSALIQAKARLDHPAAE